MADKKASLVSLVPTEQGLNDAIRNDEFLKLLNNAPPAAWVKDHPMAKGVKYLPIDKVELMLDTIFKKWTVEVVETGVMFNAIHVTVRLSVLSSIDDEWRSVDGVGAVAVQTSAGKPASDLTAIVNGAVMKALPAAKSYAIKDAAEHLGKFFGRDLNRKDVIEFKGAYATEEGKTELQKRKEEMQAKRKAKENANPENGTE